MSDENYLVALTNPVEGKEAEYNRWYDEVHVPDMLSLPGVTWGQRFALPGTQTVGSSAPTDGPAPTHRYLALYRFSGDADALMAELGARMTAGTLSVDASLDPASASMSAWVPIGDARTAPENSLDPSSSAASVDGGPAR